MDILGNLGIEPKLLAAQLINFALLLFVLHRFLYKPLLAVLAKRTETIEQSLKNAEAIEKRMKETAALQEEIMADARKKAQEMIDEATNIADQKRTLAVEKAKADVAGVIADAKAKINAEKRAMIAEAHEELGDLVTSAVAKVLELGLPKKIPAELITKVVEEAKKTV